MIIGAVVSEQARDVEQEAIEIQQPLAWRR